MRPVVSAAPPAANGTINVSGRSGNAWAEAGPQLAALKIAASATLRMTKPNIIRPPDIMVFY
jgi:hypothetical protein